MIDFKLEALGWKNFEDLSLTVARHEFDIKARAFSLGRDEGIDGRGLSIDASQTIVQSKHTTVGGSLTAADFRKNELPKIKKLKMDGSCDRYLLITNCRLSAPSDKAIRKAIESLGVVVVDVLGREAVCQLLSESKQLRGALPRMYGLGDLSEIIDERLYQQTAVMLRGADMAKFVPIPAYFEALDALSQHGIALILGEPASGKSSILAAAALALIDQAGLEPLWLMSIEELQTHWNPNRPNQLFLLDDAFGATSFDSNRTDAWNRTLPFLKGAIRGGAKLIGTSRNYVYRDAKDLLKRGELPAAHEESIVIDVTALSWDQRKLLVYNHLRLGGQSTEFKSQIKSHLTEVTRTTPSFLPETARRLGDPFFTKNLDPSNINQIFRFMTEPNEYLDELIGSLTSRSQKALLVLLAQAGRVEVPPEPSNLLSRLGCSAVEVGASLDSMDGSLVLRVRDETGDWWVARHPTVLDAVGRWLASRPERLDQFVEFAPIAVIMRHVSIGLDIRGAVQIPERLGPLLLARIFDDDQERATGMRFLRRRVHPDVLGSSESRQRLKELLLDHTFTSPLDGDIGAGLFLYLAQNKLLDEETLQSCSNSIVEIAIKDFDHWAIGHAGFQELLVQLESGPLIATELVHGHASAVENELSDYVESKISTYAGNLDPFDEFASVVALLDALVDHDVEISEAGLSARGRITDWVETASPIVDDPVVNLNFLAAVFGEQPPRKNDVFSDLDIETTDAP